MTGRIYLIVNLTNGKKYVGKTKETLDARWYKHKRAARRQDTRSIVHSAIRKYGEQNFSISVLEECDTAVLSERERFHIQEQQSFYPMGYNLTKGGDGGEWTEERKREWAIRQKEYGNLPEERARRAERNRKRFEDPAERRKSARGHEGSRRVTDGVNNRWVSDIAEFLQANSNWHEGFTGRTNKGTQLVRRDGQQKRIDSTQLASYLSQGWILGGRELPPRRSMTRDGKNVWVSPEKEQEYLDQGYTYGRPTKGRKAKNELQFSEE